jgi:hypothetical protein
MKPHECSSQGKNSAEKPKHVEPLHNFEALKFECGFDFVDENNDERALRPYSKFHMLVYPPSGKFDDSLVLEGKISMCQINRRNFELTPGCNFAVHVYCACGDTWWTTITKSTRVIAGSEIESLLPFGEKSDKNVWYIDVPMEFTQNMRSDATTTLRLHVVRERSKFYVQRGTMSVSLEEADHWFRVTANKWRQDYAGLSVVIPGSH